ncbi:hypothetical protein Verru16b_01816 [Lacunisphaera limnophila]|uniref:Transporter n=1 Tax=Lacunisphaera limnophila TaxID=1838286 RepID=A0A1D8AV18_9BACT|nr:transporter [Lacunisphaera limnophila]AOS44748.1 hypothetical protein Verru16b_01816 [Lacunisphaera limnophila]
MNSTPTPRHPTLPLAALTSLLGLFLLPSALFGQGCVIARGGGGAMISDSSGYMEPGDWTLSTAIRWFRSDRHYAGGAEQKHRQEQQTQVINESYFYDVSATYAWSKRLTTTLTLPFVDHDRTSLYEHLGNTSGQRFRTQAAGLGDMRVSAAWWAVDPNADHHRGNVALGFGIKAPTGDYRARDTFIRPAGPTERFVDSSIQPGDGAWGYNLELQGFYHLKGNLSAYGNAFYLFNPEGRVEATGFSIPDAYMVRTGLDYRLAQVPGVTLSLGGRVEGVPGRDVFGSSIGFRRPGYAISVEPGFTFSKGRFTGTLTVPVALERRRTMTYGATRLGDAAFADFSINTSFSFRL